MKEIIKLIRANFAGSYRFPIDFSDPVEVVYGIDVIYIGSSDSVVMLPEFGSTVVTMQEYYIADNQQQKRYLRRYLIDGVCIDSQFLGE